MTGVGLGAFDGVALGAALGATADGLGEGSGADGRTRATSRLPLRSCSMTESARGSTRPTPWRAARNAVSWAMTSSAQAMRVVASGPIAAIVSFVVYGPWYVLQPDEPATFANRKTAVSSVSGQRHGHGAGRVLVRVHDPRPEERVARGGVEHQQDLALRARGS